MMTLHSLKHLLAAGVLAATFAPAMADAPVDHPVIKRPYKLAPSADLVYSIKAKQRGIALSGESVSNWRAGDGKYSLLAETKAALFGKILEQRSEGTVDDYGLAPAQFVEKRFRKEAATTTFKRDSKTIVFSEGDDSYPLKGGEQDRNSTVWQLVSIARATPEKFTPGSEWSFFVAGRRDAEPWTFKVVKQETVATGQGLVEAVHLIKAPPPDKKGQQVDLWLAPSLEWYPVKVTFADEDGDYVEQTLQKVVQK
ncbi:MULTISPECIES: DUF3108 domain-containing protein [Janthinobacterium]|uniref:DUF3108 domain-containing protein n=1 Tax=Janthinobacterium aestuarii TaxID=2985511 RepID=A0ABZ2GNF8_9BURK|nr:MULTISPECIES: DUF3108 domain-containing protein [Janthinobacterium]EZP38865.1 hypothetical protein BW37_03257 [Janthinobacterium lividum]MBW3501385.1 DUF3108 domain-containing protein [Janthinobacterium sp. NKUCC08_JDC]